jgi:hypothetical protein
MVKAHDQPITEPSGGNAPDQLEQLRHRARDKKRRQRGAMTAERQQAVRTADAERKQRARRNMTADEKAAERVKAAARKQHAWASLSEEAKAAKRKKDADRKQKAHRSRRFIGVDCEGAGKNEGGQQNLVLLNAEGEGFASSQHKGIGGCEHIESVEAFEWILSLPSKAEANLVSYFFNWDGTQILRDIGTNAAKDLFDPNNYGRGGTRRWTHFNSRYAVKYIPKRYLAVARRGGPGNRALLETARYIYDVFGIFQSALLRPPQLGGWRTPPPSRRSPT